MMMARAQRTDKLERERETLESEYREVLVAALRQCAGGALGLFEQNADLLPPAMQARLVPPLVRRLAEVGDEVIGARQALGYSEPLELMNQLDSYRRQYGANRLGEQRLAAQFLHDIGISE